MLHHKIISTVTSLSMAVLPQMAMSQPSDFDRAFSDRGAEARFSFTVPLGESADKTKTSPRLDFGVRNYARSSVTSTDWMMATQPEYHEARLGFTLGETPQLMLNDQALILNEDEQANIGTAGKIGLGVAAVAVTGVAVIVVYFVTCNDCGSD